MELLVQAGVVEDRCDVEQFGSKLSPWFRPCEPPNQKSRREWWQTRPMVGSRTSSAVSRASFALGTFTTATVCPPVNITAPSCRVKARRARPPVAHDRGQARPGLPGRRGNSLPASRTWRQLQYRLAGRRGPGAAVTPLSVQYWPQQPGQPSRLHPGPGARTSARAPATRRPAAIGYPPASPLPPRPGRE